MFNNIGSKLKSVAVVICYLGIALSVIVGFSFGSVAYGLLYAVIGSLISWVSSLGMYAFGELVINVKMIANNTKKLSKNQKEKSTEDKCMEISKKIKSFSKDESIEDDEMIMVECPYCGEELQFSKGTLKIYSNPSCPHCSNFISGDENN